jgi:hypothetical protein
MSKVDVELSPLSLTRFSSQESPSLAKKREKERHCALVPSARHQSPRGANAENREIDILALVVVVLILYVLRRLAVENINEV